MAKPSGMPPASSTTAWPESDCYDRRRHGSGSSPSGTGAAPPQARLFVMGHDRPIEHMQDQSGDQEEAGPRRYVGDRHSGKFRSAFVSPFDG